MKKRIFMLGAAFLAASTLSACTGDGNIENDDPIVDTDADNEKVKDYNAKVEQEKMNHPSVVYQIPEDMKNYESLDFIPKADVDEMMEKCTISESGKVYKLYEEKK